MKISQIQTSEGYNISISSYLNKEATAIVIIASATGVKQRYYTNISEYLNTKKLSVYTFDYGGIGKSLPYTLKKFNTSAYNWGANDLDAVLCFVKKKHPDNKILVIGHSIGGQLIGLVSSYAFIDGILLVGAQTGYWKYWKGIDRMKMYFLWNLFIPLLTKPFGYFPAKKMGLSENLPKAMALEWKNWCCSKNYLFDFIPKDKLFFDNIKCKIFSYSTSDDNYAPKDSVDWITAKYKSSTRYRRHLIPADIGLKKIGHFGFFRSQNRASIWDLFIKDIKQMY